MAQSYIIYIGPHALDLSALLGKLIDYKDEGMTGLRTDLPGFAHMVLHLAEAMPLHGAAAGIPQEVYDHFTMCNQTVAEIDAHIAVATKQVEVLKESRAFYVDARQNDVGLMVDAIRSRAQRRKDRSVLIPFGPLLKYNGQIGKKALHTRKKNAEASAETETETETETDTEAPVTEPAPPAPSAQIA